MADWVLILVLIAPGGSAPAPSVQVNPVYFYDKASCDAAIIALQDGLNGMKFAGKCIPTKSEL